MRRGLRLGLGVAVPADVPRVCQAEGLPFQRTSTTVRSNGSKTHSTGWPASTGSVSEALPNSPIVASLRTTRYSAHKNASRNCPGDGVGNGAPASHRSAGGPRSPVRPGVVDRLVPGGEQPVQLGQVRDGRAVADLDQELLPHDPENLSISPLPCGGRARWVILMPSLAAARFSAASTKADPLST